MKKLIDLIKKDPEHHLLYISFKPQNEHAKVLYESLGFKPDGRIIDGEVVYQLCY